MQLPVVERGRQGGGGIVDRRMGFGGAFAPKRFERVSMLVAAWVRRKQRLLDEQQPYPPAVRRWAQRRAQEHRNGGIPGESGVWRS
eukprot:6183066-Pleurochrysis_carterae.AAC.1